jgi:hypothetical protein
MRNQRELHALSITHKASSCLHSALNQERKASKGLLSSIGKQVVGRNKTTSAMADFVDKRDYNEKVQGQIRALSNYKVAEKNPKIETMIDNQRENRRSRHLSSLKDFESWHEKLVENIKYSSEEVKKNWENFAKASENELQSMIDSFTEEKLLTQELEYVLAGYDNINFHVNKRMSEADKMKTELYRLQNEKSQSTENFLSILRKQLVEIAFQLPPEIDTFVALKRNSVNSEESQILNRIDFYTSQVFIEEKMLKSRFQECLKQKEMFWRKVHHGFALQHFHKEISSKKFVNPEERVFLYQELKEAQKRIFDSRVELLRDIVEIPSSVFSQEKVDQLLEKLNTLNENAQETYDKEIQKLVNFQKKLDIESDEQLEILTNKLEYFKAEIEEPLDLILDREGKQVVLNLKENGKKLLSKTIKFLEDTDLRAHEVCQSLAGFWKTVAKEFDQMITYNKEEEKKYELGIASRGDTMDENVDDLEDSFKAEVERLKRSITLDQLEMRLQESFKILDKIAGERRSYTEEALNLMQNHDAVIKNTFEMFLIRVGERFGLLPASQKEKYLLAYKEKRLKELEEAKPPEDVKKKPGKKEEEPKIEMPVLEDWNYNNSKWSVLNKLGNIVAELLVTEDDRAKEIERKRLEEEAKKLEEERKIAEEALRKEEAKKGKKGDVKKVEEPKIEVPVKEEIPPEPDEPIDPEGNLCLDVTVFITIEIAMSLTTDLLHRSIDYIIIARDNQIESATTVDKKNIEKTMEELDEHLRFLWPRKGKLEVNEFTARLIEIKRHTSRWERHHEESTKKKQDLQENYLKLVQSLKDSVVLYKQQQDEQRKLLPSCVNLAECQGVMRKSKDLELQLFQHVQDLSSQAKGLYETLVNRLIEQNKEFINSLTLFEKGGNYDVDEVEYYHQKTTLVDKEVLELREKWAAEFEALVKKAEQEKNEPIKIFEKEFLNVVESIAAREGMGKKYGAPRRTAQERLRAEMTKCEKAQTGIEKTVETLSKLIEEYRATLASHSESEFSNRSPSLSLNIRTVLLSIRACSQKYGTHLLAFKDEAVPPLKSITWKEDLNTLNPAPDELPLEASRLETLLDPLEDIGVQKNPLNFWQRVLEIEKNARDESLKLFVGKAVVPEFMEKYLKNMKSNAEDFRLKRIKALREVSLKVIEITEIVAEAVLSSIWYSCEFTFEQECEKCDSKVSVEYEKFEDARQNNKKLLRPNLSNPSCRKDLEELSKQEDNRSSAVKSVLVSSLDNFFKQSRVLSDQFKTRLLNNSEALLFIYDNLFTYDSFISLPGDQQPEVKRSHIKKLMTKKKTGKVDSTGPNVHKKTWPGLVLNNLKLPQDPSLADSPAITSIKTHGHKAVIKFRNESFKNFCILFASKTSEFSQKLNNLIAEEERWNVKWKSGVSLLKVKNT